MKHFLSLLALCIYLNMYGQSNCDSQLPLYRFTENKSPLELKSLGSSPQFEFLREIKSKEAFFESIRKNRKFLKYDKELVELIKLLHSIGFKKGIDDKDFNEAALEFQIIEKGTLGNTGNHFHQYKLIRLLDNEPSWKITSPTGCYFYIFTKCGNAFYPQTPIASTVKSVDTCHKLLVVLPRTVDTLQINVDTIRVNTKIFVHYFKKTRKTKEGIDSVFSDKIYWKTITETFIAPVAAEDLLTTSIRPFDLQICADTTIELAYGQKTKSKSTKLANINYQKNVDREMVLEVVKKQYKKIRKTSLQNQE